MNDSRITRKFPDTFKALALLQDAVNVLNQETEQLNLIIKTVEDRLNEITPGVSSWLEVPMVPDERRWDLGYGRNADHWHLLVRYQSDISNEFQLLKAPRVIRLNSIALLPTLIQALTSKVVTFTTELKNVTITYDTEAAKSSR
jgi:hypothetical protein